ncbi:MAG: phosphate ABC transporter permease PstA [Nitrolancea sp.]
MAIATTGRRHRRRVIVNQIMLSLTLIATALALIPLILIIMYVAKQGIGSLSVDFLTKTFRPVTFGSTATGGGVLHGIVGSGLIVAMALAIATPVGIMAGIFLAEYPSNSASTVIRFCVDVLSAMPSIVVGVTAYVLIVQRTKQFSGFAGSIALVVLMVPIITRTTEEILHLVPSATREAAIALGAPKWKMTLTVVLPVAMSGIATGVLLAFARAAGETAPLLVTILGNNNLTYDIFGPMQALPLLAYRYTEQPYQVLNEQAWGAAFLLVVFVLGINIVVRVFTRTRSPR